MSKIYRHKFSVSFLEQLKGFADLHRFDEIPLFIEHWNIWIERNKEAIGRETMRLKNNGYDKDVLEKMYKSVRYYYKNKPIDKSEPKKRSCYKAISVEQRKNIDNHIDEVIDTKKPSEAYDDYIVNIKYISLYLSEKKKLINEGKSENEAENKIKKTYKNRYFKKRKE